LTIYAKVNLLEGNKEFKLNEEKDNGIIERYEELDIPFNSMQAIGAGILRGASFEVTLANNDVLFDEMILLADTSDPFLKQVNHFLLMAR
jgi:hypothetical protein